MSTIGAFEAKTHLSMLLERVAQGEEIVITRHGKPLARLIPVADADRSRIDHAISKLKALRKGCTLDGLLWQELRDAMGFAVLYPTYRANEKQRKTK